MTAADLFGAFTLGAAVLFPLIVGWVFVAIGDRRKASQRRQLSSLEIYAARRARKNDTMRRMRRVASEHRRSNHRR
ncbi:hypothetical protein ABID94_002001 [Streptomyces sp. PvR018]